MDDRTANKLMIFTLLFFLFSSFPVFGQMGYETRDSDNIKGPVRLYKKLILKDFKEKFGDYETGSKEISQWYIYDEAGHKIFDQKPPQYGVNYIRHLYYFEGDKLKSRALEIIGIDGKIHPARSVMSMILVITCIHSPIQC